MNCTKRITLTGYQVRYTDLREAKPRAIHDEVYLMDKDALRALGLMGINVADFITKRYERGGYYVTGVEKLSPRRIVSLDLRQLWDAEGDVNSQAPVNLEVESNA